MNIAYPENISRGEAHKLITEAIEKADSQDYYNFTDGEEWDERDDMLTELDFDDMF